jgi:6-phosphogluconolactonase
MDGSPEIIVVDDPTSIAEAAAGLVLDTALEAVETRGRFHIALAGGATPRTTYERLAASPFAARMPWARTWIYFGDERGVEPDHPDSNYGMAHRALLSRVAVPAGQVFRIRGEEEDLETAAAEYAATLKRTFETRRGELPRFDLVLLGLGVDGHTASLFPGSPALREVFRTVAAVHAGAAAVPRRVTLTLPVLTAAARVLFLASGAEKAKAVRAVLLDRAPLPATMVEPVNGRLSWLLDRDAASLLPAAEAR